MTEIRKLEDKAREVQENYPYQIVLAEANGKFCELTAPEAGKDQIRFITITERVGLEVYRRGVSFLMLKAISDLWGKTYAHCCKVETSVDQGYFCYMSDWQPCEKNLQQLEQHMKELVAQNLPIEKKIVSTDEAIRLLKEEGMIDKVNLFRYRRSSCTSLYWLGDYMDYFYGYMVPSTGYLKYFKLYPYGNGFVLQMPNRKNPNVVPEFAPSPKLFHVLEEQRRWQEHMGIHLVADLNDSIVRKEMNDVVLVQEALMEKRIADIAEQICESGTKRIILIAGPSSSGKTTFSHRLSIQLRAHGMKPQPIEVDNYFVNRVNSPRDEEGNYNFEDIECIDRELLRSDIKKLLAGEKILMPTYNFLTGYREYKGNSLQLQKDQVLVLEGIHCLNPALLGEVGAGLCFKIYISALTQMNVDLHNRISTTDGRLIRRIVRDARTRGNSAKTTIAMWENVRKGEEKNIFPYQEEADVIFNSSLLYEPAVLKQYVEPLLLEIPQGDSSYGEAHRLLKFFNYFLGMSNEDIPKNSIVREFIGGSCFKV
ncbi:MAG: nucleoside kinase [Lachnospiraceae bacterium]